MSALDATGSRPLVAAEEGVSWGPPEWSADGTFIAAICRTPAGGELVRFRPDVGRGNPMFAVPTRVATPVPSYAPDVGPAPAVEPVPDTTPPVVTATVIPPAGGGGWHTDDATVELATTDGDGSGVAEIRWTLEGAQTGTGSVMTTSASVPVTAEGETVVRYSASD